MQPAYDSDSDGTERQRRVIVDNDADLVRVATCMPMPVAERASDMYCTAPTCSRRWKTLDRLIPLLNEQLANAPEARHFRARTEFCERPGRVGHWRWRDHRVFDL